MRVTFVAGRRARDELGAAQRTLASLAQRLTTSPSEALVALDKLRAELAAERERGRALAGELAQRIAAELPVHGDKVIATVPHATVEMLRSIAGHICKRPGLAALLAGTDDQGCPVVFSRSDSSTFHCGDALKDIAKRGGGRGGGREHHAEGRLPAGADLAALYAEREA